MFVSFAPIILFYILILYVPGSLCLWRADSLSKQESIALSPLISVLFFAIAAVFYDLLKIPSSFLTLFVPITVIGVAILCFRTFKVHRASLSSYGRHIKYNHVSYDRGSVSSWAIPLLYIIIGMICCYLFFIKRLDGPNSVSFDWDNHYHLNAVQSFAQSADYSSLGHVHYVGTENPTNPTGNSFYPSAWHGLAAMACNSLSLSVPFAINALNASLIGIVYPLGFWLFFKTLFPHNRKLLTAAAFLPLAFTSSLWDFTIFGPLYGMILSYSLVAPCMSVFLKALHTTAPGTRASLIALFGVGLIAIAFAHTSGIFLMAVFLSAAWVQHLYTTTKAHGGTRNRALISAAILAAFCLFIWILCYKAPFLQNVVNNSWGTIHAGFFQALANVALLSFNNHPAQPVLSVLVFTGIIVLAGSKMGSLRNIRWLLFPLVFFYSAYLACALTSHTFFESFLGGFWYADPHRLAANVVISAIPLAALGLSFYLDVITSICESSPIVKDIRPSATIVELLCTILLFICVFYPNFTLPETGQITTSFGKLEDDISYVYSSNNFSVFQPDERAFAQKVIATIPPSNLIINTPNDGSGFMYALYGANIYYRNFQYGGTSETWESQIIRTKLNEYATNPEVQKAVRAIDAKYVLVMNQDPQNSYRPHFIVYHPEEWIGIESIDHNTKGFSVVLSDGSMTLYKIDPLEG